MDLDLVSRMHFARAVAREAGRLLMSHFGRIDVYDEKLSTVDLVSIADRQSDQLIAERIQGRYPSDLFIAEESDGPEGARAKRQRFLEADYAWIVDPLDGTTSFVHGYPYFSVSIGVAVRGQPALGVVYAPYFDELFVGGVGIPATLNARPIQVSRTERIERALLATGFAYDRQQRIEETVAPIRRTLRVVHDVRRAGSAALDMCHVACGRLEGYFEEHLSPWDVAAGEAIVNAAGGQTTGYDLSPHDIYARSTLASNGRLHAAIAALLKT